MDERIQLDDRLEVEIVVNEESGEKLTLKKLPKTHVSDRYGVFNTMLMQDFRLIEAGRNRIHQYEGARILPQSVHSYANLTDRITTNSRELVNFTPYGYKFTKKKRRKYRKDGTRAKIPLDDIRTKTWEAKITRKLPLAVWAHWILYSTFFSILTILVVLTNLILLAIDSELGEDDEFLGSRKSIECIDYCFLVLFLIEICLKWIDDFIYFWFDLWNIFDLLVSLCSLFGPIINIAFPGKDSETKYTSLNDLLEMVKYVRVLRIFRSINVISRWHKVAIVLRSIGKSLRALVFISILTTIFFYVFAILGMNLFESDPDNLLSNVTGIKYRYAFKNIQCSLVTLFHIFTDDHWFELIEDLANIKGWLVAVIYVIIWIILGSFIFKNIFAGVMVNTFQNIRLEQQRRERDRLPKDNSELGHKLSAFFLNIDIDDPRTRGNKPSTLETWEEVIKHELPLIRLNGIPTPAHWPRDCYYHFFMLMESSLKNLEERDILVNKLCDFFWKIIDD